jgi:hypothetical protein
MPIDIRINEIQTDMNVLDPSALLTPQVRDQIVRAVLAALDERMRDLRNQEDERSLGSQRERQRRE